MIIGNLKMMKDEMIDNRDDSSSLSICTFATRLKLNSFGKKDEFEGDYPTKRYEKNSQKRQLDKD